MTNLWESGTARQAAVAAHLPSFTALQPPRGRSHRHSHSIGCAAERPPGQEALMSDAISPQHPAVVLRSHYMHLRTLLAIAMIAVVGLTVAVVMLATDDRSADRAHGDAGHRAASRSDDPFRRRPRRGHARSRLSRLADSLRRRPRRGHARYRPLTSSDNKGRRTSGAGARSLDRAPANWSAELSRVARSTRLGYRPAG